MIQGHGTPLLTTLSLAVTAFISTNVDDLLVLVGFFSDPAYRTRAVVVGQFLGIATLIATSAACALGALVIPGEYIGLLGVLPIAIGLRQLRHAWLERDGVSAWRGRPVPVRADNAQAAAVAWVTIANGGDNLGTYIPMFTTSPAPDLAATVIVFLAMTALWCLAAHALVRHVALGARIQRWGGRVLPFVLIALGVRILYSAGTLDDWL